MDPANVLEAMREIELDIDEGRRHDHGQARDALPGRNCRPPATDSTLPLAAYQVLG